MSAAPTTDYGFREITQMKKQLKQTETKTDDRLQIEGFEPSPAPPQEPVGIAARTTPSVMPAMERPRILRVGAGSKNAPRVEAAPDPSLRLLERVYDDLAGLKQGLLEQAGASANGDTKGATVALDAVEAQLKAIAQSVEFTEAYVTAGLANRIGEMLREETATSLKSAQTTMRAQRHTRIALLLVGALGGLLAAEIASDAVSTGGTNFALHYQAAIKPALIDFFTWTTFVVGEGAAQIRAMTGG
ncbi:hypothetical protein [Mesorhizobium sp. CAU 1741]|uniref:hypothetical protein n=1 Tax=Mesorhizobium sp. CAU 1741 TaxID=3140366 RepID=UPI00325B8D13